MTAEEKLALLDAYEVPEPDLTGYIQKSAFDKTASELAEAKRQLKAKLTEEEQKEAERAATAKALQDELETLRKEKTVSAYVANFLSPLATTRSLPMRLLRQWQRARLRRFSPIRRNSSKPRSRRS